MRYWLHKVTNKLLRISVQMAPCNWDEITKEEYYTLIEGINNV